MEEGSDGIVPVFHFGNSQLLDFGPPVSRSLSCNGLRVCVCGGMVCEGEGVPTCLLRSSRLVSPSAIGSSDLLWSIGIATTSLQIVNTKYCQRCPSVIRLNGFINLSLSLPIPILTTHQILCINEKHPELEAANGCLHNTYCVLFT